MNIPATVEDVRGTIERPLTPDEERVIPNWLDHAWGVLQREVKGIPTRVALPESASGYLSIDDVKGVLTTMVERKVRNPDGLRTWNGDDYGQTVDAELSSGKIYVTAAEKASLAPRDTVYGNGIYSIPLGRY